MLLIDTLHVLSHISVKVIFFSTTQQQE